MEICKQVNALFKERGIHYSDPLSIHFDILHEVLQPICLRFGSRFSSLVEDDLRNLFKESADYLIRRFQMQEIDITIPIEKSEPVIQKYISAFLFIFQRRIVYRIKQHNHYLEILVELLEEFEKRGLEELKWEEIDQLQKSLPSLLHKRNVPNDQELILSFLFGKFKTWFSEYRNMVTVDSSDTSDLSGEKSIRRIKRLFKEKRKQNRRALEEILMDV